MFCLLIRDITQDITDVTVQKHAEIIDRHSAERFIVTQPINGRAANPMLVDERISADAFFLQSLPKWFICNHATSCLLLPI